MSRSLAVVLAALFFGACAEVKPERFLQDKPLYEHAMKLFQNKDYTDSIPFFESLKNRFPQSPYATESELKIADAYFAKDDFAEAEASYESFRSLHPTHPQIPYVVSRIGMTHFKRIPSGIDRDPLHTERALAVFNELVTRWPDSPEAKQAAPLAKKCERALAQHEMYVANFYIKQKQFEAALVRLRPLSRNGEFPDLRAEAAYKLGYSYLKLKSKDDAIRTLEALAQDPAAGKYAREAQALLPKARAL
ncbi:MAG: outer membrane protein assembly factor BamD [Pseudomonadota bacterium]